MMNTFIQINFTLLTICIGAVIFFGERDNFDKFILMANIVLILSIPFVVLALYMIWTMQ